MAKLATHVGDYALYQIEISKNYTSQDWRGDLRNLLFKAGAAGEPTTFLFNDNQVTRIPGYKVTRLHGYQVANLLIIKLFI